MKRIKMVVILVYLGWFLLPSSFQAFANCTSVAVGKDASIDGSTMICIVQGVPSYDFRLQYIVPEDHEPGTMRVLPDYPQLNRWWDKYGKPIDADQVLTGVVIPQVSHTYGYMRSLFGVMNEHQVGFAMATVDVRRKLWNDTGKLRITILSMIAAERAKTAREAIEIIGNLAEKYGFKGEYTSAKGLAIADPDEVWILHIMQVGPWDPDSGESGAVWAAQRIPDDEVVVFPNGFQIGKIDFNDLDNFMYSSNIKSFAEKMGWYDPKSDKPFNFREAYWGPRPLPMGVEMRKWRGCQLLVPSLNLLDPDESRNMKGADGLQYRYPFSFKLDKKVSVADLARLMRDRGEGTKYDLTKGPLAGRFGNPTREIGRVFKVNGEKVQEFRSIAWHENYTEILQMRNWLPDPIGGIVWWGPGRADTSTYYPFYCGINKVSEHLSTGNSHEMEWGKTAYWAAAVVDAVANTMWNHVIKDVKEMQHKIENEAYAAIPEIDKEALELYRLSPEKAREFLTQWSNQHAEDVMQNYWDFAKYIFVKYRFGLINKPSIGQFNKGIPELANKEYVLEKALDYQKKNRKANPK